MRGAARLNKNFPPPRELPPHPNSETKSHARTMAHMHWELLRSSGAQTLVDPFLPADNGMGNLE
jgi:hypothetical protein